MDSAQLIDTQASASFMPNKVAVPSGTQLKHLNLNELQQRLTTSPLLCIPQLQHPTDQEFTEFAQQFGELLSWDFGYVLELKHQAQPKNHLFNHSRVELHWDGVFAQQTPKYLMLYCVQPDSQAQGGGETLFVDTASFLQASDRQQLESWRQTRLRYRTAKKAHYGGCVEHDLVCRNPNTGAEVIRYIEAFNEDCQQINPMDVQVVDTDVEQQNQILRTLNHCLYHSPFLYQHRWQRGDLLIADNRILLHGRRRFINPTPQRILKRIHVL